MEIKLKLDVYNPAEFYGALGFLELVSQQDCSVTSHFESEACTGANSTFLLRTKDIVLPDLSAIKVTAQKYKDALIAPVTVDGLELNWWLNQFRDDKNSLKMWAGTSRPVDMLKRYQQLMGVFDENVLQHLVKVKRGKSSFGFDTRASRDALRQGYSEKEAGDASALYPETEFLCAIGLQNFRPAKDSYFVWRRPVPVSISHVAAIQEVAGVRQDKYTMTMGFVGQGLRAIDRVTRDAGTNYAKLAQFVAG
jgi:CRISPR-associated protein Csb3